jgi:hypothetical protein
MKTTDDFFEAAKAMTPLQKLNHSYSKGEVEKKKDAHTKAAYLKTKKELEQMLKSVSSTGKVLTSVQEMPKQHSFKLTGPDVNKIVNLLDLMVGLRELGYRNYQIKKYPSSGAVVLLHWSAIEAKLDRKWKNIWTANPWQGR